MEVLILGAAGMVGQKLLNKLIIKKSINGPIKLASESKMLMLMPMQR